MVNFPCLPVTDFFPQIIEGINSYKQVVITAGTGAGKTSLVPLLLHTITGRPVIVTQPRVLAAIACAERAAEISGTKIGTLVGYKTAKHSLVSAETKVLFVTDGLMLVHEILGQQKFKDAIFVLDEIHEFNIRQEALLSLVAQKDKQAVIMSATIDATRLLEYLPNARLIDIPGKMFHVQGNPAQGPVDQVVCSTYEWTKTKVEAVKTAINEGHNSIYVFEAGKSEINTTISEIQSQGIDCLTFPLHGELEKEEQQRVFCSYDKVKVIVGTNIGQTSITIPDLTKVISTGVAREASTSLDGLRALLLTPISKADIKQQAGRAGRVQEGSFTLVSPYLYEDRKEYSTPEILRSDLKETLLQMAAAGFRPLDLKFYHQPGDSNIQKAWEKLVGYGLVDKKQAITFEGKRLLPLIQQAGFEGALAIETASNLGCLETFILHLAIQRTKFGSVIANKMKNDEVNRLLMETMEATQSDLKSDYWFEVVAFKIASNNPKIPGLNWTAFNEVKESKKEISRIVRNLGINLPVNECASQECFIATLFEMEKSFFQIDGYIRRRGWQAKNSEEEYYGVSNRSRVSLQSNQIISGSLQKIQTTGTTFTVVEKVTVFPNTLVEAKATETVSFEKDFYNDDIQYRVVTKSFLEFVISEKKESVKIEKTH